MHLTKHLARYQIVNMVGLVVHFKAFSEHLDVIQGKTLDIHWPPNPSALLLKIPNSCLTTSTANFWITPCFYKTFYWTQVFQLAEQKLFDCRVYSPKYFFKEILSCFANTHIGIYLIFGVMFSKKLFLFHAQKNSLRSALVLVAYISETEKL